MKSLIEMTPLKLRGRAFAALLTCALITALSLQVSNAQEPGENSDAKSSAKTQEEAKDETKKLEEHLAAAERLVNMDRADLAAKRLIKSLEASPRSAELLKALGKIYLYEVFNPGQAVKILDRLVTVAGHDDEARYLLADSSFLYSSEFMYYDDPRAVEAYNLHVKGAVAQLNTIIERNPKHADAHFLLGEILRRHYRVGKEESEDPTETLNESVAHFEKALEINPKHERALRAVVDVLTVLNRVDDAWKHLQALLDISEVDVRIHQMTIQLALSRKPVEVELLAKAAAAVAKEISNLENQIIASVTKRVRDDAKLREKAGDILTRLQRALSQGSGHVTLVELKETFGEYLPELPADSSQPIPEAPVPEFAFIAGHQCLLSGDFCASQEDVRGAQRNYRLADTYLGMAMVAVDDLPDIAYLLGHLKLKLGQVKEAQEYLRQYGKLTDDQETLALADTIPVIEAGKCTLEHFRILMNLLSNAMAGGKRKEKLEALAHQAPDWWFLRHILANEQYRVKEFKKALEGYNVVVRERPEYMPALIQLSAAQIRLQRWEAAKTTLETIVKIRPESHADQRLLELVNQVISGELPGRALALVQESLSIGELTTQQVRMIDEAIALAPGYFEALIQRAQLAAKQNQGDTAEKYASMALAAASSNSQRSIAYRVLADAYALQGNSVEANKNYDLAIEKGVEGDEHWKMDEEIQARILYAQARFLAKDDPAIAGSKLRRLVNDRLPLIEFRPSKAAADFVLRTNVTNDALATEIAPHLKPGAVLDYAVEQRLSRVGGGTDIDEAYDYTVQVRVLETPNTSGLYELEVTLGGWADDEMFATLEGAVFTIKVSPWFGLMEVPFTEESHGYSLMLPLVQALVEPLTIGLGDGVVHRATTQQAFMWWNPLVRGRMQFVGREQEVCWLDSTNGETKLVKRLAIDDFRSSLDPQITWEPRKQIQVQVELATSSRIPRDIWLRRGNKELVGSDGDTPDVIERFQNIRLKLR